MPVVCLVSRNGCQVQTRASAPTILWGHRMWLNDRHCLQPILYLVRHAIGAVPHARPLSSPASDIMISCVSDLSVDTTTTVKIFLLQLHSTESHPSGFLCFFLLFSLSSSFLHLARISPAPLALGLCPLRFALRLRCYYYSSFQFQYPKAAFHQVTQVLTPQLFCVWSAVYIPPKRRPTLDRRPKSKSPYALSPSFTYPRCMPSCPCHQQLEVYALR